MRDPMSQEERSRQMSLVKGVGTKPEIELKRIFWDLGYHYRYSNWTQLPGKPDIVFVKRKKAVFMHGCFWHRHENCVNARIPKSRIGFWTEKLNSNVKHDQVVYSKLTDIGWEYLVVWECELIKRNRETLVEKIIDFMHDK